jgi:zinc transporter ZupT
LHSLLDGWNIGIALSFPDQRLVWTFLGGIALHKLSSGFAIGAVFRADGDEWTIWLLALTSGSFL